MHHRFSKMLFSFDGGPKRSTWNVPDVHSEIPEDNLAWSRHFLPGSQNPWLQLSSTITFPILLLLAAVPIYSPGLGHEQINSEFAR